MAEYQPAGPYVIIRSKKRKGKAFELLMFEDYGFLVGLYEQMEQAKSTKPNLAHQHLRWLMARGEDRQPKMLCPHCQERPVAYFSLLSSREGISVGVPYTCCENPDCRGKVEAQGAWHHLPFHRFQFSVQSLLESKFDRRQLAEFYRIIFQLPRRLTRQEAFKFFNEPGVPG